MVVVHNPRLLDQLPRWQTGQFDEQPGCGMSPRLLAERQMKRLGGLLRRLMSGEARLVVPAVLVWSDGLLQVMFSLGKPVS